METKEKNGKCMFNREKEREKKPKTRLQVDKQRDYWRKKKREQQV